MSIFSPKVVYTDILADYRKVKVGKFNLFDKVVVTTREYGDTKTFKGVIVCYTNDMVNETYPNEYYEVIGVDGKTSYVYIHRYGKDTLNTIVPDYGEFQEEMEALEESVALQQKAEALRKELIETTEKANKAYEKGKSMVNENMEALKIMKSPIISNG